MSTSMRKVDRLMLQVETAIHSGELEFMYAMVCPAYFMEEPKESPNHDKWEVQVFLSRGRNGKSIVHSDVTSLDPLFFDTKEEAMEAAKEIEAVHSPTGNRVPINDHVYITMG